MKVVIIGSGNTATVLGHKMLEAGHRIVQVVSRQKEHAARLAAMLNSTYTTGREAIDPSAELYLLAVPDDVLYELGEVLSLPGKLVAHTAGTVSKEVLQKVSKRSGVLYPLQSLRKEIRPFPEIPFLVDAHEPGDRVLLMEFARTMSGQVVEADDGLRLKLHLAAVLVNNFTNFLYTLAADFCRREGTDFALLLPIIKETADRLGWYAPREVQTGPAIRGDKTSVERHLSLLANYEDIKELYSLFTNKIEAYYQRKEFPPS